MELLSKLRIGKLGSREKRWIVLWVVVVLWVGYARMVHQPRAHRVREMRRQITNLEQERRQLNAKQPDLEKRQAQISSLKDGIAVRYQELTTSEQDLLNVQDVDELLNSLVKDRRRFEMLLNSIRPIQQQRESSSEESAAPAPSAKPPAAEPYHRLRIQLDAFATFQGLVSYIDFLERMRPYQEVEGIKVKVEGKEVSRPHAVLVVTTLMAETQEAKEARRKEVFALLDEVAAREQKDPFLTADRPKEMAQAVGLVLTGILSENGRPVSAMINNEIYRIGDVVDNKRIVTIEPNAVFLEQGNRRFVLVPNQQKMEGGQ